MQGNVPKTEPVGFADYAIAIARWKKMIVITVAVVTIATVAVTLLLQRWYVSSSTILPPKNSALFSGLGLGVGNVAKQFSPLRSLGALGNQPDIYNYVSILKSRTLMERVVRQFGLEEVYGTKKGYMDDAIQELSANVDTKANEEGTLSIEVADRDPQRAAAMAEYFVTLLDEMNRDLNTREASGNREFIESRVDQNIKDMAKAEDELKSFQEKHGFVSVSEQAFSSISPTADLYLEKMKKEIEVGLLRRTLGEDNPSVQTGLLQLSEIDKKLKNVPELGIEYLRLYRSFIVQQKLFETLVPMLEQARIEEHRDTPTLLVLDHASVPERASRPKRMIIVLVFFVMSLLVSASAAIMAEQIRLAKTERPSQFDKFVRAWTAMTRWTGPREG